MIVGEMHFTYMCVYTYVYTFCTRTEYTEGELYQVEEKPSTVMWFGFTHFLLAEEPQFWLFLASL